MSRELLEQARDALNGLTDAKKMFLGKDEQLLCWKAAWDAEAAIDAELVKPEEPTIPLGMLRECAKYFIHFNEPRDVLDEIAAKYGYKVV